MATCWTGRRSHCHAKDGELGVNGLSGRARRCDRDEGRGTAPGVRGTEVTAIPRSPLDECEGAAFRALVPDRGQWNGRGEE